MRKSIGAMSASAMRPVLTAAFVLLLAQRASAQLFENMQFNQYLKADYLDGFTAGQIKPVTATVLPIHQTVSVNDGYGGVLTTTYDVTDNGSVASIGIASSGSITTYNSIQEAGGVNDTRFTLAEPAFYTATIAPSGDGQGSLTLGSVSGMVYFESGGVSPPQTLTFMGLAQAGTIDLAEDWGLPDDGSHGTISKSGGQTVTLTFTTVPEPSSAVLIATAAAFFLGCCRRKFRQQSAILRGCALCHRR